MGSSQWDEGSASRDLQALRRWPRTIRYSLVGVAVAVIAASGWALGRAGQRSASSSSAQITSIETKQREHEARLAALQLEITESEKRVVDARRRAELERCHADAERIDAAVAARAADCVREQATVSACEAQNEMSKGKSMQNGCAIGLLAAVFTGGSALLLTGGGCLLGEATGEGKKTQCPESNCKQTADRWMSEAATAAGRKGIPVCELGVELLDAKKSLDGGVFVSEVFLGAASAGLKPGDMVVQIHKTRTRTKADLEAALSGASHGQALDVQFVRDGVRRTARVKVVTHADGRPEVTGPMIGIRYQPVPDVPYVETRVAKVEPGAASGLTEGDVVERIGKLQSVRAIELARSLASDAGDGTPFIQVRRKGRVIKVGRE